MKMGVKLVLLLLFVLKLILACPEKCQCTRDRMFCKRVKISKEELELIFVPTNITEVHFEENGINELSSKTLQNLKHLSVLEVSNNGLNNLPDNLFNGFNNLKSLILNNNLLSSLREELFNGLINLRRLEIKENQLQSLPPGVFDKLYFIQVIRLSGNQLIEIPNKVFTSLKWLRDIFLSNNKLTHIGNSSFQNLTMNRLVLSGNKLKTIPVSAFKGFDISGKIVLLENPLDCHCEHAMNYAVHLIHLRTKIWGYCKTPYYMMNKHVLLAHKDMLCTMCNLKPCRNGGRCTGNKTAFTCGCSEKFKGKSCEIGICDLEVKYITKVVRLPFIKYIESGSNVPQKQKIINRTEYIIVTEKIKSKDDKQKLMILYAMCSLEFLVILSFVAYFGLRRYKDWKLQKKYEHEKSRKLLLNIRNDTNAKLAKSLCQTDEQFPFDVKNMILKGAVPV